MHLEPNNLAYVLGRSNEASILAFTEPTGWIVGSWNQFTTTGLTTGG